MAIADKLNELITQRNNLADNLNTMGVSASQSETLTTLVPKVLDIQAGGGSEITKGLKINAYDSDGYVTDAEIVGMTSIPDRYFSYIWHDSSLFSKIGVNLHLPNNITSIGERAFYYCKNLTMINLPNSLTDIKPHAFYYCTYLGITELPDNITNIGQYAFAYCANLAITKLPSNLTSIGQYAFQSSNLAISELPENLTSLSDSLFTNCSKITISEIPSNITSIPSSCFNGCSSLTKIDILSENLSAIYAYAFDYCSKLSQVIIRNTTPPTLKNNAFRNTPIASGTGYIYVPDGSVSAYQTATNWSAYASQIKGISELGG